MKDENRRNGLRIFTYLVTILLYQKNSDFERWQIPEISEIY
jgi:hypothetical protein